VKNIWTVRVVQAAERYGEQAPMAAVCCNACRTCATTNLLSLGFAAISTAGLAIAGSAKRILQR
jgi:hypothetical protein